MANIDVLAGPTAKRALDIVGSPIEQDTQPALEEIILGAPVRYDPTTGKFRNGNATDLVEGNIYGVATRTVVINEPVTAIRKGAVSGLDLAGIDYGDPVFVSDTDARLADDEGTETIKVGHVAPHTAVLLGAAPQKILTIDILDALPATGGGGGGD